jgi:hypothetical protein
MSAEWRPVGADDFTADGRPDIAWFNTRNGELSIWRMKRTKRMGSMAVSPPPGGSPPTAWAPFATVDMSGDGVPDFVWHERSSGRVAIWSMSDADSVGSSTLVVRPSGVGWPDPSRWRPVGAGDMTRDGQADILWQDAVDGSLVVWVMGGHDGSEMVRTAPIHSSSFPPPTQSPIVWR